MIRFFRHIRQTLMEQRKVRTYLMYAIGEIALVMIGILLALQVNNWNEDRIQAEQQTKTVNRLYAEFQSNYEELTFDMIRLQDIIDALEAVILMSDSAEQKQFTEEEIIKEISASANDPTWNPSSFVLADLKSNGQISSLQNKDLVDLIFSWERFYENLMEYQVAFVESNYVYVDYLTDLGLIVNISNEWGVTNSASVANGSTLISSDSKLYNLMHKKLVQAYFLNLEYIKTAEKLQEIIDLADL